MSGSFSRKAVLDVKTKVWYDGTVAVITSANGAELNVQNYRTMIAHLKTTDSGGTTPTLDVKWQTKMPNGDWVDIPGLTFTQITGDSEEIKFNIDATLGTFIELGQKIRPVFTIGGTSPTFKITFDAVIKS